MEQTEKNEAKKSQAHREQRGKERPPKEFLGQKEFFSMVAKAAGFLAGAAGLFVLFGYTIIFSFISTIQLSGLASFQQEYYKDAAITFVADLFKSYAAHPFWFVVLFVVIAEAGYFLFKSQRQGASRPQHKAVGSVAVGDLFKWTVPLILVGIIVITLNLKALPDRVATAADMRKLFLFVVAVPMLAVSFLYLAFKFNEFKQNPFRYYYLMTLLCLGQLVSIPVSYGENIFNIDLFHIVGVDYSADTKNDSLDSLKHDIREQGEGALFYLMGHTSDRDVIIDNQGLRPPLKMILIERNMIKYLKISTKRTFTLRDMLMGESAVPIPPANAESPGGPETAEELPNDIKALLNKE